MKKQTRTNIDIETAALERFKELYPAHGSIKWFVNSCFAAFVELHGPDPDDLVKQAVEETLREKKG